MRGTSRLALRPEKGSPPPAQKKKQTSTKNFPLLHPALKHPAPPADFGPRERARGLTRKSREDGLIRLPGGKHVFRGIPFLLGSEDALKKSWIALSSQPASWVTHSLEIPLNQKAAYICLAQFCDWDPNERPAPGQDVVERVGQMLAEAVLVYGDGGEQRLPIRR